MEDTGVPVLLSGILENDPEPFLTKERLLGCRLTVRARTLFFVRGEQRPVPKAACYTIEIFSSLRNTLFSCAAGHCRVTVPGMLDPETARIRADLVYCLP